LNLRQTLLKVTVRLMSDRVKKSFLAGIILGLVFDRTVIPVEAVVELERSLKIDLYDDIVPIGTAFRSVFISKEIVEKSGFILNDGQCQNCPFKGEDAMVHASALNTPHVCDNMNKACTPSICVLSFIENYCNDTELGFYWSMIKSVMSGRERYSAHNGTLAY